MALDASSCRVALGVMTIPVNIKRRDAARQTWMATAGPRLLVRFLLRALGLPRRVRNELTDEVEPKGPVDEYLDQDIIDRSPNKNRLGRNNN